MINFVIPSIGRDTLRYALASLINQSESDWECLVGFDGLSKEKVSKNVLIDDARIHYLYFDERVGNSDRHGNAGLVRNKIISNIENDRKWIGFVDDDDTLDSEYVKNAKRIDDSYDPDAGVFRMRYDREGTKIIPPPGMISIQQN